MRNAVVMDRAPERTVGRSALVAGVLFGLLALLLAGQSRDFENYTDFFAILRNGSADDLAEQRFEPLFTGLAWVMAQIVPSDVVIVALMGGLSVLLKWRCLNTLSASRAAFIGASLLYLVRFAPLHELTQIRLALATALWLLTLTSLDSPRKFWCLLVLMPLMHYSTLLLVPLSLGWRLLVQDPSRYLRLERRLWWAALGSVALLGVVLQALLEPLGAVFTILSVYSDLGFGEETVNVLNVPTLLDAAFLLFVWICRPKDPAERFWLWTATVSLAVFAATRDFPVIAHRLHEMLNLGLILYLATALSQRGAAGLATRLYWALSVPLFMYLHAFSADAIVSL